MFYIQASNPRFHLFTEGEECNDLSEAIEEVFPMSTEDAFISWEGIWVPCGYKYDLSVITQDILPFLDNMLNNKRGETKACFGSDTFTADWFIEWDEHKVDIQANWKSVCGGELIVESLNQRAFSHMGKDQFLFEWKSLLFKLKSSILASGIKICDITELTLLNSIEERILDYGYLYSPIS